MPTAGGNSKVAAQEMRHRSTSRGVPSGREVPRLDTMTAPMRPAYESAASSVCEWYLRPQHRPRHPLICRRMQQPSHLPAESGASLHVICQGTCEVCMQADNHAHAHAINPAEHPRSDVHTQGAIRVSSTQLDMGWPGSHPDLGGSLVLAGACTLRHPIDIGVRVVGQNEVVVLEVTCARHTQPVWADHAW